MYRISLFQAFEDTKKRFEGDTGNGKMKPFR